MQLYLKMNFLLRTFQELNQKLTLFKLCNLRAAILKELIYVPISDINIMP